ncbi:adenosylcobinamide-GDP ribazoletransferase [Puniceibacterium sp. IMCC21224]|uniref:adenosylcobinamide-GDP ribazoletransferase n=1 Tax=Puniceibacterium sp. IMCC21224 TaxID=1618204 RepID=UPI00064E0860|nr:adenosylcobinamide-GDP ribazoletransferase [Puniceibacterium sp. IMCC21224]KMK67341.1 cobalamin-5'-phosphate synthase [Puniceibacterium sp. IMCC21224]
MTRSDFQARLAVEWGLWLLAVQFLTRIPVPRDVPFSDDLLIRATKYYPLVGVLVGGIGGLVLWGASLALSPAAAVLLSVATTLLLTGAFHEDGLADAADGLGGGLTRERSLEIMRDSRIGTYGAVTLGVTLALKVALLASLEGATAGWVLVAGHALGRMAAVHVIATTPYARDRGAKFVAPTVTPDGYRVALATALMVLLGLVMVAGPGLALLAAVLCVLLAQAFRWIFVRKLGGYTGDCLGGTQQLGELGIYLAAALWL